MSIQDIWNWFINLFNSNDTESNDTEDVAAVIADGEHIVSDFQTVVNAIKAGTPLGNVADDANKVLLDLQVFVSAVAKLANDVQATNNVTSQSVGPDDIRKLIVAGEKIIADLSAVVAAIKDGKIAEVVNDAKQVYADAQSFVGDIRAIVTFRNGLKK